MMNYKALNRCFLLSLFLSFSVSVFAQKEYTEVAKKLYDEKKYQELCEYTDAKLQSEEMDDYTRSYLEFYQAHCLNQTGRLKESYDKTKALYYKYEHQKVSDTPTVRLLLDICQKYSGGSLDGGFISEALLAANKGLEICEKQLSNDHEKYAGLCLNASGNFRSIDSFDLALQFIKKGEDLAMKLDDDKKRKMLSLLKNEEAIIYAVTNRLNKTKAVFQELLDMAVENNDYGLQTKFYTNLGIVYELLFDYGKSEQYLLKALETNEKKKTNQERDAYIANVNLARVYGRSHDYEKAEKIHFKNIESTKKFFGEDSPRIGGIYLDIANTYVKRDMHEEALIYYKKNLEISEKAYGPTNLKHTDILSDFGGVLVIQDKVEEGLPYLRKAIENRKKHKTKSDRKLASPYLHLTNAYLKLNKLPLALAAADSSILALGLDYNSKGQLDFNKVEIPMAITGPFYMRYELLLSKSKSGEDIAQELALLDNRTDSLVEYLKYYFEDEASRKVFVRDLQTLYSSRLDVYSQLYEDTQDDVYVEKAFDIFERSKNYFLYESIAESENSRKKMSQDVIENRKELVRKTKDLKVQINGFVFESTEEDKPKFDSLNSEYIKAEEELYAFIQNLEKDFPEYYSYVYDVEYASISDVEAHLSPGEIMISYYEGEAFLMAITIDQEGYSIKNLGDAKSVKNECLAFINTCKNSKSQTEESKRVYDLLIQPLNISAEKIIISTDGVLSMLPFEAIINSETDRLLIYDHTISYQYSGTIMTHKSKKRRNAKGLIAVAPGFLEKENTDKENQLFADLIRSNSFALPSSLDEVQSIGDMYKGTVLTGINATKEALIAQIQGKNIIHFATHGIINDIEPTLSGLTLYKDETKKEELLNASEIAYLDLNADLVTLSACNTGAGKYQSGEGVESLGRAFAFAGCKNQVLSLWSVNDKSTNSIMNSFYSFMKDGMNKGEALRKAKLAYLDTSPDILSHPYYWSAFTYYGEDVPLHTNAAIPKWTYLIGFFVLGTLIWGLVKKQTKNPQVN